MERRFVLFLTIAILLLNWSSVAIGQQTVQTTGDIFFPFAKCSFVVFGEFTYEQAAAACRARQGDLDFFVSPSEEHMVRRKINWNMVPGFQQKGSNTWTGQLWLGIKWSSQQKSWILDNALFPGFPLQFTGFASSNATPSNNVECAVIREDGWVPLNCNGGDAGSSAAKLAAGALCTSFTRQPPGDSAIANSDNYCQASLMPQGANLMAQAIVARKNFLVVKGNFTFSEALDYCMSKGGYLASTRTPEEVTFINKNVNFSLVANNRVWIGLKRQLTGSSSFVWVDDGLPNYNTAQFSPYLVDTGDCVTYERGGYDGQQTIWNKVPCTDRNGALCSYFQFL